MKGYDIMRPTLDTQGEISYIPKPKKQVLSPITITSPTRGVQIIVAGGPGPCWIGLLKAFGGKGVTEKVELPANWDKLVEKYRDMVPYMLGIKANLLKSGGNIYSYPIYSCYHIANRNDGRKKQAMKKCEGNKNGYY